MIDESPHVDELVLDNDGYTGIELFSSCSLGSEAGQTHDPWNAIDALESEPELEKREWAVLTPKHLKLDTLTCLSVLTRKTA